MAISKFRFLQRALFTCALASFVSAQLTFAAKAEVYVQDKIQMISDFMDPESFRKLWLPLKPPAHLYLSQLYLNYDSRTPIKNNLDVSLLYSPKKGYLDYFGQKNTAHLWFTNSTPLSKEQTCSLSCEKLQEIYQPNSGRNIKYCYAQTNNATGIIHFVDNFMGNKILLEGFSQTQYKEYLNYAESVERVSVIPRNPHNLTLNTLNQYQDTLQMPRQNLWFIEKYLLPRLKQPFWVPRYLPANMNLLHFDMIFSFSQEQVGSNPKTDYSPFLRYVYQAEMLDEKKQTLEFDYQQLHDCQNLGLQNPKLLRYTSKKLGKVFICTTQEKIDTNNPNQMKPYFLGVIGKPFQLRSQNLKISELIKVADNLDGIE